MSRNNHGQNRPSYNQSFPKPIQKDETFSPTLEQSTTNVNVDSLNISDTLNVIGIDTSSQSDKTSYASSNKKITPSFLIGVINAERNLNLRKQPWAGSEILKVLNYNDKIMVKNIENGPSEYLAVLAEDDTIMGYCLKKYVTICM